MLSLLIHDIGHVAAGRLFGLRLGIVWYGLGSRVTGLEALPRRPQRLAVHLAGPLAQLLVFTGLWFVTQAGAFVEHVTASALVREWVSSGVGLFMIFSLVWGVINLLPIWPLDGGFFFWEWCAGLFGRPGPMIALIVCILVSAGLGMMFANWIAVYLPLRFDPRGSVSLQQYAILLAFSVFFLTSGSRAWRAEYRSWRAEQTSSTSQVG